MFAGYEPYIAVILCLFCTYLGYLQGRKIGIETAIDGLVQMNLLKILNNGEVVAGSDLKQNPYT